MVNKQNNFKSETSFDYKADLIKALYKKIAKILAPLLINWGFSPNQITISSGIIGSVGALLFLGNTHPNFIMSSLFLQIYIIFDFADGLVARKTKKFSYFGVWLDIFFDKLNDLLIIVCFTLSVFFSTNNPFHLIIGLLLMGSVFFTQFIFLLNDTLLKQVLKMRAEKNNELFSNHQDKKPKQQSNKIILLIKLFFSQISLNHAKLIFLVSFFALINETKIGLYILFTSSLLTLSLCTFSNFKLLMRK